MTSDEAKHGASQHAHIELLALQRQAPRALLLPDHGRLAVQLLVPGHVRAALQLRQRLPAAAQMSALGD